MYLFAYPNRPRGYKAVLHRIHLSRGRWDSLNRARGFHPLRLRGRHLGDAGLGVNRHLGGRQGPTREEGRRSPAVRVVQLAAVDLERRPEEGPGPGGLDFLRRRPVVEQDVGDPAAELVETTHISFGGPRLALQIQEQFVGGVLVERAVAPQGNHDVGRKASVGPSPYHR